MELLLLFALSVPIFYIIGIIAAIKSVFGKKHNYDDRSTFLRKLLEELSPIAKESPQKAIVEVVKKYKTLTTEEVIPIAPAKDTVVVAPIQQPPKAVQASWDTWYSDNSINLLLYIGAFFIVASASIFVGFQWETIGGTLKALVLTVLTAAFFITGIWFSMLPKIKNAGLTFIAIAAILVPFNGVAWHNFVFGPAGHDISTMWIITSGVAMILYAFLAYYIRSAFYTYIAGAGGLSLLLSFVHIARIDENYYILAGIFFSFISLLFTKLFGNLTKEDEKLFLHPLTLSAHVTMPASLLLGFFMALANKQLFSFEASLGVLLASAYYLLVYFFDKKQVYVVAAQLLFPISIALFTRWLALPLLNTYYLLDGLSAGYFFFSLAKLPAFKKEQEITSVISLILAAFVWTVAFTQGYPSTTGNIHTVILALIPTAMGLIGFYFSELPGYFYYHALFLAITLGLYTHTIVTIENKYALLGVVYTIAVFFFYQAALYYQQNKELLTTFLICCSGYIALTLITTSNTPLFLSGCAAVFALLFFHAARRLDPRCIYLSNAFLSGAFLSLLHYFKIPNEQYVLYMTVFSYCVYSISLLPTPFAKNYQQSALTTSFLTTFLLGLGLSFDLTGDVSQRNGILSAYAATLLFTADAFRSRDMQKTYFASTLGLFTYVWQIYYLGYEEKQLYALPLGLYCIALAYLEKRKHQWESSKTLDILGILILYGTLLYQTTETNGFYYALLLGIEGIIFFVVGNTIKYNVYTYSGIAGIVIGVLSESYEFVLSLPRWIITAVFGILFLGAAISLLLKRKE